MEHCGKKVMIQLMVGNYLRYTDRSAEEEDLSTSAEEKKKGGKKKRNRGSRA